MTEQLADIARVYVHKSPCKLYDESKFLGVYSWATLNEATIRNLLNEIFIINSDLLPGFESRPNTFDPSLATNMSEEQRSNMILTAKTYKVFEAEPGSFIAQKGDDLKCIDTNTVPIVC
uniref:Uncharacterized protein n=1 Tax=Panagrolaimus sp. PS1159 TaxID=55785 RepID=A0AC35F8V5_9BILA